MQLTEGQLQFLQDEFDAKPADIENIERKDWQKIREKCFDIEVAEAVNADNNDSEISDRGEIAASIASIKYSELTAG